MKPGRIFVTNVLILATAAFLACTSKSDKRSAQVKEGNKQIEAASAAQGELNAKFKVSLASESRIDFNRLSKADRQTLKETLAGYVSAVTRTLEIDAKKGIYLTQKEVVQKQLGVAMNLQKSLENFERTYGENFDPKIKKSSPFAEAALPDKKYGSI